LHEELTTDTPPEFDPTTPENIKVYKKMELKKTHTKKRYFHGRF